MRAVPDPVVESHAADGGLHVIGAQAIAARG